MTDQRRATPEQWDCVSGWSHRFPDSSCILELRARVEALEAAQGLCVFVDDSETRSFKIDTSKWSEEQRQQFLGELSEPGSVERFTDPRLGEPWMVRVDGIQHGPTVPAADSPAPAPADSLVERVASALIITPHQARAAIREVAAWLREGPDRNEFVASALEQEAAQE